MKSKREPDEKEALAQKSEGGEGRHWRENIRQREEARQAAGRMPEVQGEATLD